MLVAFRGGRVLLGAAITYGTARFLASSIEAAVVGSPRLDPPGEIGAAVLVGAVLAWLTPMVTGSSAGRAKHLALVLFASVGAVMLEGGAFAPALSPLDRLPLGLVLQLGVSLATAGVAVALSFSPSGQLTERRPPIARFGWRVAACTLIYVLAYFVTGAVNYALVTGPYYTAHAGGLTTPPVAVVLVVAVIEGLVLTVGTVPLARDLVGHRWIRALACGLTLWLLGGVVPLLQQAGLPDVIRVASAVEILFQKAPLGIAVVWLVGRAGRDGGEPLAAPRLPWVRS